jgi:hypothetical protein
MRSDHYQALDFEEECQYIVSQYVALHCLGKSAGIKHCRSLFLCLT